MPVPAQTKLLRQLLVCCGTISLLLYVFPARLHSDQGANFEVALIVELLRLVGVEKSHTTLYHPMGNGQAERFNRTLGTMIRALPPPQMLNIQCVVVSKNDKLHTYSIRHPVTGRIKTVHRNLIMSVNFLPLPSVPSVGHVGSDRAE